MASASSSEIDLNSVRFWKLCVWLLSLHVLNSSSYDFNSVWLANNSPNRRVSRRNKRLWSLASFCGSCGDLFDIFRNDWPVWDWTFLLKIRPTCSLVLSIREEWQKVKNIASRRECSRDKFWNLLFGTHGLRAGNAIPRICAATFGTLLMLKITTESMNSFNNDSYLLLLFI